MLELRVIFLFISNKLKLKMKFATAIMATAVAAKYEADRVNSLPEMGTFDKYGAFSGYLDIADTSKKIHYLFFEA